MTREAAEKIANTVLYEGYMLYPYRPSSVKNQQRWNFGTLYPPNFDEVRRGTERAHLHAECLFVAQAEAALTLHARFLQLGAAPARDGWDTPEERAVEFRTRLQEIGPPTAFDFGGSGGHVSGSIRCQATALRDGLCKLSIDLVNETPLDPSATRDEALRASLLSAHVMLYAKNGEFISLLDPPEELHEAARKCHNVGCFPVLVGDPGERGILLCSPIILYDYPQIAPESAGDFFDSTEMDEMLTLRVMTLTPEEKDAMRAAGDHVRALLERTEATAREQLVRTHGAVRSFKPVVEHE